jgi:phospholipid/cholesterol/gamma-HCH transport system substrate-binding protein
MSARRRSRKHEVRVGLLLLVAVVVFGWMAIQVGAVRSFGGAVTVTVVFDDAAGLVTDSAVKVAGVQVGSVKALEVDHDKAVATLVLDRDAQIREDVLAQVRARSLLGEKFVALFPASTDADLLADGDLIAKSAPSVEIADLVATLGPVLSQVNPDDVARIVGNVADMSDQLGADGPILVASARELLDKLNDAAAIAPDIKRDVPPMLADLRRTAGELESTVARADALLTRADEVLAQLDQATAEVPEAVSDARRLMAEVEPGMDDLGRALEQSDEALQDMRKVLDNFSGFDEEALRRLLREEGVLIRLKAGKEAKIEKN